MTNGNGNGRTHGNPTAMMIAFAHEFVVDMNQTQAAIRAGAAVSSAASVSSRWMRNVNLQELIAELAADRLLSADVTADRVIGELAMIAFSKLSDVVTWDAEGHVVIVASDELSDAADRSMKKLKMHRTQHDGYRGKGGYTETRLELDLHDKLGALNSLVAVLKLAVAGGVGGNVFNFGADSAPQFEQLNIATSEELDLEVALILRNAGLVNIPVQLPKPQEE
jgi:phage terminase small subunit